MKTKKQALLAGVSVLCIAVLLTAAGIMNAKGFSGRENDPPKKLNTGIDKDGGTGEDILSAAPAIDFSAQYIRTYGSREDARYPTVKIIRSVWELNEYYEANKEDYGLGRRENVSSDTTIGFLDACDQYDDAYFADHILIMVLLEEYSGSNRHTVQSVRMSADGHCSIYIDRIVPEAGTCDMAEWHILIGLETKAELEDVNVFVDGVDPLTQPEVVRYGRGYANVSLTIPDGWEYQTGAYEGNDEFLITFWPAGRSEGKMAVLYYDSFGVCGTFLEQEEITLGRYEARKGTYDGRQIWDFISLIGTPGHYVIENEGAGQWWDEYGGEAMGILNTLIVGDGYISEAEAIAIAEREATVEYNLTSTSYDSETGLWTVILYKEYTAGGDQTVAITCEGKVTDIQYGE